MAIVVNGERIEKAQVHEEIERLRPGYEKAFADKAPQERESELLEWSEENLIERTLFQQELKKDEAPVSPAIVDAVLAKMYNEYDSPEEAAWSLPRRVAQPRACFTSTVRLLQPLERYDFTRTYIKALQPPRSPEGNQAFWNAADQAQESGLWRYAEIDTNHMVASNKPEELTELLLELA